MSFRRFRHFDSFGDSKLFWLTLVILGCAWRVWLVTMLQNPFDARFSDAMRHWDNAKNFLDPGPMGNSNPVFYQLWLHVVQVVTAENRIALGIVVSGLSLLFPFSWYLFAREIIRDELWQLRFTAIIAWLPTFSCMYMYFFSETLLMPLLGASFWLSWRAVRLPSASAFLSALALWICAVLTRPVVLPAMFLAITWCFLHQRRRVVLAIPSLLILVTALTLAALHSYKHFYTYSPFGNDGKLVSIYFLSGSKGYGVTFTRGPYYYIFESPSFSIKPFEPFSDWQSQRSGVFRFSIDREERGADIQRTFATLLSLNYRKLPRLVRDNLVFTLFGHSWPESHKGRIDGFLCIWERWIWFPIFMLSQILCGLVIHKKRWQTPFLPALIVCFTVALLAAQFTVMEGRYRKPLEPLWLLSIFWFVAEGHVFARFRKGVTITPNPQDAGD